MDELPEFWRTEVFHPISVHLPVALLLVALIFKVVSLRSERETWSVGGRVLLFIGVVGAWVSVYTGNLADGIVAKDLCDPTVLKDHENASLTASWLFTCAFLLDLGFIFAKRYWLRFLVVSLMLVGSGFLIHTGHLGARLVYQQAAGVHVPSADCAEFE